MLVQLPRVRWGAAKDVNHEVVLLGLAGGIPADVALLCFLLSRNYKRSSLDVRFKNPILHRSRQHFRVSPKCHNQRLLIIFNTLSMLSISSSDLGPGNRIKWFLRRGPNPSAIVLV